MSRAPKSRFKSVAGKKIEKQVRKAVAMFRLNANSRRSHGVASGANHGGKLNISSNERVASATMNASKTNRRDNVANDANRRDNFSSSFVGQTFTKDSNSRHLNSSTMYLSLDPSLRNARKNNRRDDGSLATLSRINHKRSVSVATNRQVNHASRPIKQDPPRKNTNTKRVESIMPEEASPKQMKKQMYKEAKGDDTSERDPMGQINGDAYPLGVEDNSGRSLTYGSMKRQRGNMKANEDEAIDNGDMKLMEVEDRGTQLETKKRGIESNEVGDGKADDSFAKKNLESSPKDHVSLDCSDDAIPPEKLTHRKLKKRRQGIMRNYDEELHIDGGDHSPLDVDPNSSRLTSQAPISIDCLAEVPAPFGLDHVKQQCSYCSKPIDEPIWSGIFNIDAEEYMLAGHLSTKSCDKVWKLSRSLMPVVEVTKLSMSKFKTWETSKPSCDSIGLYFFPNKMRHDENLDKLVKGVIEDDLVLQTVIGEAEILIFPSTLLPERYKTFQRKHYLWGLFRPRQDQCATVAEPVHGTVCRAQEIEKEEQHASNQQDEAQQVHWKSPAKSMQQAAATRGVPGSRDMDFRTEASEERQLGDALGCNLHSAEDNAVATNLAASEAAAVATNLAATEAAAVATNLAATEAAAVATNAANRPAEATENDTNAATNVPSGRFFCFVAGQTPKLEQLIQEMQREGSLVVAIRGEAIGGGLWPGNIESTNISRA